MKITKENLLVYTILFCTLTLYYSCNTTEPEIRLEIALEDVSCTESWLKVTGERGSEIILKRDDIEVERFTLSASTQIIYDDSLLPNKTYSYQVSSIRNQESSSKITVTTLDTTSHNFTWQTWTFGDVSSSTLYDCAIISEDNIWCVGEINIADTSENGYRTYNAVHWNGSEWELKRITAEFRGNQITPPLEGIFAFSGTDIWFVSSLPIHGNGENWIMYDLRYSLEPNISLSKVWGASSNNIYFVGLKGNIAHYQNGQWGKIESGTDLPIRDIYGSVYNNEYEILCVADSYGSSEGSKVISIKGGSSQELWNDHLPYGLDAIWFVPQRRYIVVGDGLWETRKPDTNWVRQNILPALHKTSIHGEDLNDIVVCGAFWLLAHYNGLTWQTYFPFAQGSFTNIKMKNNIVVAVGGSDSKAIIAIGRR